MTQSCLSYFILLVGTLVLLANCHGPEQTLQELQCNSSKLKDNIYFYECGINSTILVVFEAFDYTEYFHRSYIRVKCYSATPLRMSLPLNMKFTKDVEVVHFDSCQFSEKDDIFKILTVYLRLSGLLKISFNNELFDISLTSANIKPLNGLVRGLGFKIKNLSTLPMDLFEDLKTLNELLIFTNYINSTHLSGLLAPLENLNALVIETNNLQEISESNFLHNRNLLDMGLYNISILPPCFLSYLSNLKHIYLFRTYFRSLPKDLFQNNKNLEDVSLAENRVALKHLPEGLCRNLPFLRRVEILGYGLETIDADIFSGSKNLTEIYLMRNNLHQLPLTLFADQKFLRYLDISRNMIKTLPEGIFNFNKNLWGLNLAGNQLTNLSINIFKPFVELRQLFLDNNNLLTIRPDSNQPQFGSMFDHHLYLRELRLKNNSITEIPYNIIKKIPLLTTLDLSSNKINSINCNFVTFFDSIINISGNPIDCGERNIVCLHQHIIQNPMVKDFGFRQIRCESPVAFKGRLLYDLELSDLLSFPDITEANFSKRCTYKIRISDSVLVMNCSNASLNDIPMFPILEQSFSKGIELHMDKNPLTELSNKILKDNPNVIVFKIFDSRITYLPKGFLSGMTKLKTVSLVLPLTEIPNDIFLNSIAIEILNISGTNMESFPELIFANQSKVTILDLSRNKLKTINDNQFKLNIKLETICLSHNFLEELPRRVFYELTTLKTLFLDNNRLKCVQIEFNSDAPRLTFLNMENNEITDIDVSSLKSLQTLILRNNLFVNAEILLHQDLQSAYVDLSLNKISSMALSGTDSFNLNKAIWNFTDNDIQTITVSYKDIYLNCNGMTNSLVIDNKQSERKIFESLICFPYSLQEVPPRRVSESQEEFLCPISIDSICPENCHCWIRPAKSTLIVNCSNAQLTEVPSLPELETIFQDGIELYIEHNKLRSLKPNSSSGLKGVVKIFAAHNNITNISIEDIPENLIVFNVSYNQIDGLHEEVMKVINESQILSFVHLKHNAFKCDCPSGNLNRIIFMNKTLNPDIYQCLEDQQFKKLSYASMCLSEPSNTNREPSSNTDKVFGVIILIMGALLLLTIFYFKNKDRVLIWMYAHNICLCWVTEKELDREKRFDAFISYSSWDMDFVGINLIPKLESGSKPYKLCLHDRDWLAGGFIPKQIEQSVECSRRTVIVMSQNYINSKWARFEFRTAHNASMNEKRPRVIVIMLDDNIKLENLDSDLRKYIKMYTYIRWNDPWFWDKLTYAMPHPSKKKQKIKKYQMSVIPNRNTDGSTG